MKEHKIIKEQTDNELLDSYIGSGDKRYYGELFKRYTGFILSVSMKYLKNEADSKDMVMHIFEKLMFEIKKHDIKNFKKWLYTVTKNECFMKLRSDKSQFERHIKYEKDAEIFMENSSPMHPTYEEENVNNHDLLYEGLKGLDKEQRICIELFYLKEKSYKEVADITGFEMKKVKSYIQNGKRNLKIYLTQQHE